MKEKVFYQKKKTLLVVFILDLLCGCKYVNKIKIKQSFVINILGEIENQENLNDFKNIKNRQQSSFNELGMRVFSYEQFCKSDAQNM